MECFLTGVLEMPWLLGPSGVEFSEEVDSWRVRGLWRDGCMLARVGHGLGESTNNFGDAGGKMADWRSCFSLCHNYIQTRQMPAKSFL